MSGYGRIGRGNAWLGLMGRAHGHGLALAEAGEEHQRDGHDADEANEHEALGGVV